MKTRSRSEAIQDIAMSLMPVASAVHHGRKGHKEGFEEASQIYEKKFAALKAQNQQIRIDVLGEEQVLICPQAWDSDFWQKKLEVFVREHYESNPSARDLLLDFIQFCIETFPKRRLAQTLKDLKTIQKVIRSDSQELVNVSQDDIQLAIDFLSFFKDVGEVKKMKEELVALQPSTKGCNFLVLGKTGVGKSSLLNSLLGVEQFKTGTGKPITEKGIHESEGELDGLKVRVYDSWGIEAGATEDWLKMLKDAQDEHDVQHKVKDWFHAVVYCVNAGGSRIEDIDRDVIRSLLADDLYVVVALTQSDLCSAEKAQVLRETLTRECEKLLPENVIETCVGGETRNQKTEPFGIEELKRAILKNYKRTILAQLPSRCIYLAKQRVEAFKKKMEDWIDSREWKYDENENILPLKQKCEEFASEFTRKEFPEIVREELVACSQYARNLATVLQFDPDDVEKLIPHAPPDMNWLEKGLDVVMKALKFLTLQGGAATKEEQARLRCRVDDFCEGICGQIEGQRKAIERKVSKLLK